MKNLHPLGIIFGIVAWFIFLVFTTGESSCAQISSCNQGDLILQGVFNVGLFAPSYVVALIASVWFWHKD